MKITVLEHQKIYISKNRDLEKLKISKKDADILRTFDINNGIFKWGNNYVIPQQWIGIISFADFSIEILPKIADKNIEDVRNVLIDMFKVAHDIPIKNNIDSNVHFVKNGLIELLIYNFTQSVNMYIKSGLINLYKKNTNNLSSVKGTIDFSKQITKNAMNPTRFICKYSKLDINNTINHFIKFTLVKMKQLSKDYTNIKNLNNISLHFHDVSLLSINQIQPSNIKISRNNFRLKDVINYCNVFLDGLNIGLAKGNNSVSSMLFDMNKLFEKFIYKSYKKLYSNNVSYQYNKSYLLENTCTGTKKINLKPDIIITDKTLGKIVLDTKWKLIKKFIKESDAYQMNAYISSIDKVNSVILLYPYSSGIINCIGDYKFLGFSGTKLLKIRGIDLSLINKSNFNKHLLDILN